MKKTLLPRTTRRCASVAMALLFAATSVAISAAPAEAKRRPKAPPRAQVITSFNHSTFNVKYDNSLAQIEGDVRNVMNAADVVGLQEFSWQAPRTKLRQIVDSANWGIYMPDGGGIAVPIIWSKTRFTLLSANTLGVHGFLCRDVAGVITEQPAGSRCPDDPPGTPKRGENVIMPSPPRAINYVTLRDNFSGRDVSVVNTHAVSNASFDAQESDAQLVPYLKRHFSYLRSVIFDLSNQGTNNVIAGGDFNVNYLADRRRRVQGFPTTALGDLVTFNMPLTGSRSANSLLDYNISTQYGELVAVNGRIQPGSFNSDHRPVSVTYQEIAPFSPQRVISNPRNAIGNRVVLRRLTEAINAAPAGTRITVLSRKADQPDLTAALMQASARGVNVQVAGKRMRGLVLTFNWVDGRANVTMTLNRRGTWAVVGQPTTLDISNNKRVYRKNVRTFMKAFKRGRR